MKKTLQHLKQQLISDYKATPIIVILESVGTVSALVAAACLSLLSPDVNFALIFAAYLTGSVCWFIASLKRRNSFNMILNLGFGILNIIGLSKALFGL